LAGTQPLARSSEQAIAVAMRGERSEKTSDTKLEGRAFFTSALSRSIDCGTGFRSESGGFNLGNPGIAADAARPSRV